MAGVAGKKRLRSSEHAVANGAASRILQDPGNSPSRSSARAPPRARGRLVHERGRRIRDRQLTRKRLTGRVAVADRREAELCWWRWMLLFLTGRVS